MPTSKTAAEPTTEAEARGDLRHYAAEIAYMETHDISEELANSPKVHFEFSRRQRRYRFALDPELAEKLTNIARQRGITPKALLNQWVREKIAEIETANAAEQAKTNHATRTALTNLSGRRSRSGQSLVYQLTRQAALL